MIRKRFAISISLGIFFITGALVLLFPLSYAWAGGPQLYSSAPIHNFGRVETNQVIEHTFTIENTGNRELIIQRVRTSCGCTAAEVTNRKLAPGESTGIGVSFNLKGRRGDQEALVIVESNDRENPVYYLRLKGTVFARVYTEPSHIDFGKINRDQVEERTITLFVGEGEEVNITEITTGSDVYAASLGRGDTPGTYTVTVKTVPPFREGLNTANMIIRTDHPGYPKTAVWLNMHVVGEVVYYPKQILIGEDDVSVVRHINISTGTAKRFRVTDVNLPSSEIKAVVLLENETAYRLKLSNLSAAGGLDGKSITIHIDTGEEHTIRIPIAVGSHSFFDTQQDGD